MSTKKGAAMKLYGTNPVLERLKSNHKTIQKIYVQEDHPDREYIQQKAKQWGIQIIHMSRDQRSKVSRNINAQGVWAEVEDFAYIPYGDFLENAVANNLTLLFLDSLNDPQNLGSILRSVGCLGNFAVVLPAHDSVGVTEAVLRVACGGDNYTPVSRVQNLAKAIGEAKDQGYWIAGTVVTGGKDIMTVDLPTPLGLIIGSEQKGVRDVLRKKMDMGLTIPMTNPRLSLNVAQAATIFCYEILRQKSMGKEPRRGNPPKTN